MIVILGLDPSIHHACRAGGWMLGSSPSMTKEGEEGRGEGAA